MPTAIRATRRTARRCSCAASKVRTGRAASSMDMLTVDLTDVPEARVGSPVVLWGEGLPVDDVAQRRVDRRLRAPVRASRRACPHVTSERRRRRHRTVREAINACTSSSPAPPASSAPTSCAALNDTRRDRHHRRRQPLARRQVPQPRRLRDRRLPRQGRVHRAAGGRRLRRRRRGDPAPGRVLRHDGDRRALHDAQQLPLLGRRCSTTARTTTSRSLYASCASVYGAGTTFRRGARARGAAQRLRLLQVPVRPVRAPHAAGAHGADRRLPLLQRLRPARAAQGRAWRRSRSTSSTSIAGRRPRAAVRRLRRLRSGRAAARLRAVSTTWSRRTSTSSTQSERSGIFNLGIGARADVQRRRASTVINAVPRARAAQPPLEARGARARGRDRLHPIPAAARRQVPELHAGRPCGAARRGLRAPMRERRGRACALRRMADGDAAGIRP